MDIIQEYDVNQTASIFIPRHMTVTGYYGIPSGVCPSIRRPRLFSDISFYSFFIGRIMLKIVGQLDHEMI